MRERHRALCAENADGFALESSLRRCSTVIVPKGMDRARRRLIELAL